MRREQVGLIPEVASRIVEKKRLTCRVCYVRSKIEQRHVLGSFVHVNSFPDSRCAISNV